MKSKQKKIMPLLVISSGLILTGCSNSQYLSKEKATEFASYVSSQTSNPDVNFNELQDRISESIGRIEDKQISSDIINNYIYVLYNEVGDYISYFNLIGNDLNNIKKELNIEKIDVSMHKNISKKSKVIGAILEEMENKDLMLIDEHDSYSIEVDMNKIIKKYEKYLTSDVIEFMKFRASESENAVYDANADKYNINLLVERASVAIDKLNANTKSSQLDNWKSTVDYYYQVILAEYTTQFLDGDGKKVTSEYITELKSILEKYKDKQVYNDISKYIELLEKNDREINAEDVANYRVQLLNKILYTGVEEE